MSKNNIIDCQERMDDLSRKTSYTRQKNNYLRFKFACLYFWASLCFLLKGQTKKSVVLSGKDLVNSKSARISFRVRAFRFTKDSSDPLRAKW